MAGVFCETRPETLAEQTGARTRSGASCAARISTECLVGWRVAGGSRRGQGGQKRACHAQRYRDRERAKDTYLKEIPPTQAALSITGWQLSRSEHFPVWNNFQLRSNGFRVVDTSPPWAVDCDRDRFGEPTSILIAQPSKDASGAARSKSHCLGAYLRRAVGTRRPGTPRPRRWLLTEPFLCYSGQPTFPSLSSAPKRAAMCRRST